MTDKPIICSGCGKEVKGRDVAISIGYKGKETPPLCSKCWDKRTKAMLKKLRGGRS